LLLKAFKQILHLNSVGSATLFVALIGGKVFCAKFGLGSWLIEGSLFLLLSCCFGILKTNFSPTISKVLLD
jgi:hypothetical protein